jgi:hypothetical protein
MQHAQHSFANRRLAVLTATALLLAANIALAGTIAKASAPDPLLNPTLGPCAGLAAGPDYAAGTDADGHAVAPADVGAGPVPLPESIAIPLHGAGGQRGRQNPATGASDRPYVTLDGGKLAPLLNPPACH